MSTDVDDIQHIAALIDDHLPVTYPQANILATLQRAFTVGNRFQHGSYS